MSLQAPPNGTGSVIDTLTTVATKERQAVMANASGTVANNWAVTNTPAAAAQATVTQAAGAASVYNVCTSITAVITTSGTAQTILQVNLRGGTTGAGTILWSASVVLTTNQVFTIALSGLNIFGTAAAQAMTLEFSAAGVAASVQSVSMTGYTTA